MPRFTRRYFALALFGVPARPQEYDELKERTLNHLRHVQEFAAALFGCVEDAPAINAENCKVWREETNRKAFERGRDSAKKLYDLKEKKP
jgi:hypothetical protein